MGTADLHASLDKNMYAAPPQSKKPKYDDLTRWMQSDSSKGQPGQTASMSAQQPSKEDAAAYVADEARGIRGADTPQQAVNPETSEDLTPPVTGAGVHPRNDAAYAADEACGIRGADTPLQAVNPETSEDLTPPVTGAGVHPRNDDGCGEKERIPATTATVTDTLEPDTMPGCTSKDTAGSAAEAEASAASGPPAGKPGKPETKEEFEETILCTLENLLEQGINGDHTLQLSRRSTGPSTQPSASNSSAAQTCPPRNRKLVNSLDESMLFWEDCLHKLDVEERERLVDAMNADSMSTAFSGVGCPEVSMQCLRYQLQQSLETDDGDTPFIKPVEVLSMVEWDATNQKELLLFDQLGEEATQQTSSPKCSGHIDPDSGPCLFGDIGDFWRPELRSVIRQLSKRPGMALETLAPIVVQGRAITPDAFCLRHQKRCRHRTARRHIAGIPCVGYSRKGCGLLCEDPSIVFIMCWVALRLLCQEPCILVENVKAFPLDLMKRFFQSLYYFDTLLLDAVQFGAPVARERRFIILRHRTKVLEELSPVSAFNKRFMRACNFAWSEYWFMHKYKDGVVEDEASKNLAWAQSRPTSKGNGVELSLADDPAAYSKALTETEASYVEQYRAAYPKMAWQLNQDPYSEQCTASTPWALSTLIHNSGLLFYEGSGENGETCPRWLFATEALACQGFPVIPGVFNLADATSPQTARIPLCSFNIPCADRKVRAGNDQAGNSMHTFVLTVLQLHTMVTYRWQTTPCIISNVALAMRSMRRDLQRLQDARQTSQPRLRLRQKTSVP